jgi:hypothetical protein
MISNNFEIRDFERGYQMGLRVAMLRMAECIGDIQEQHNEEAETPAFEIPGMLEGIKLRLKIE